MVDRDRACAHGTGPGPDRQAGFRAIVLWVLRDNQRARRFYERAGFAPDGAINVLTGLGGVIEVRYQRPLDL